MTTSSIYPHPLIKLLCNFSHHRTLLTFHSLKSLFSRHLCKNAFLASKPRPSPSIHYSFILPLYLPKKRRNYPKSLTVTLSTRNISLGNSMIASLFPQAPIPTFWLSNQNLHLRVPQTPQLRLPKAALLLLPPGPGSLPELPRLLWQLTHQTQHSESTEAPLSLLQHFFFHSRGMEAAQVSGNRRRSGTYTQWYITQPSKRMRSWYLQQYGCT